MQLSKSDLLVSLIKLKKTFNPKSYFMISYAQNYEDVILNRIFRDKEKGIYIDVGANDPIEDNLTYHFYLKGWTGINFEPNQAFFKKLQEKRATDTNIDFGCSEKEEILEFKEIVGTGLSTFSNEFENIVDDLNFDIIKHQIKCVPIKKILEEQKIESIDFMSIDVEGFELNVLKGNDWEKFRPKVIVLEAIAPTKQEILTYQNYKPFLESVNYTMRYFDGLNVFFTDNINTNIPDNCFYPPNFFDEFEKYSTIKEIERIKNSSLYVNNKLSKDTKNQLLKLRTKDLAKILFKKIRNKFTK